MEQIISIFRYQNASVCDRQSRDNSEYFDYFLRLKGLKIKRVFDNLHLKGLFKLYKVFRKSKIVRDIRKFDKFDIKDGDLIIPNF